MQFLMRFDSIINEFIRECIPFFQSEEDKQLQDELNMLVERLSVSHNFNASISLYFENLLLLVLLRLSSDVFSFCVNK